MSDDPSVIELVTEVLDSGRSPEEVCCGSPHQLDEVRRRVARCRNLAMRLDDLFTAPDSGAELGTDGGANVGAGLPQIPSYQLHAVLGEGGVGVVYSARHLKLKRLVALKMLRSGAYASSVELGRFALEAEAIAGMRHPHVVQIFDLGEVDGRPYFTMEYLEGGSLAQKLAGATRP